MPGERWLLEQTRDVRMFVDQEGWVAICSLAHVSVVGRAQLSRFLDCRRDPARGAGKLPSQYAARPGAD